jgi:hypothetical protein
MPSITPRPPRKKKESEGGEEVGGEEVGGEEVGEE